MEFPSAQASDGVPDMAKTIVLLGLLCGVLLCSNAYLLYVNSDLVKIYKMDEARQLPALGAPITPITVHGVAEAADSGRTLNFAPADHAHLLLVMSPDCPYCKQNWPMWDALVKKRPGNVDVTYFDVTGKFDKNLSAEHGIKNEQLITASLDSAIQARIVGTPTTVLIASDGTVKHVWQGPLDQKKVDDIIAMSM
jgi:thiol-disulfide isomerase/thioredoxin